MINLEFTERISALRRELIDAIIAELGNHGVTSLEFPDDLERCERPWQVCTDGAGDPCECYVSKIEICGCDNNHLRIYSDGDYISCTTLTSCDYEAKDVEFQYSKPYPKRGYKKRLDQIFRAIRLEDSYENLRTYK